MKKIIVSCLTISILLGLYGSTRRNTKHESELTIVMGESTSRTLHDAQGADRTDITTATPTPYIDPEDRPSDEKIIRGKKNGDILWRVYTLESSAGKNDGCRLLGKYNGFGYRQNTREHACFDYFEEVAYYVDNWFEEKLQTYSIAESLCGYNLGFQSPHLKECVAGSKEYPYYKNYLSI